MGTPKQPTTGPEFEAAVAKVYPGARIVHNKRTWRWECQVPMRPPFDGSFEVIGSAHNQASAWAEGYKVVQERANARFQVWDYDLCGNPKDGWEVNDRRKGDVVNINLNKDLFDELKRLYLIEPRIRRKSVEFEGEDDYTIYVNDVRNKSGNCPAFELERVRD
jgi:hypothetical protein